MKVLFSRGPNDFEHVYDLPSVPRVGEHVGLLRSPNDSSADWFVVADVQWSPDHTRYEVSVVLKPMHPSRWEGAKWDIEKSIVV